MHSGRAWSGGTGSRLGGRSTDSRAGEGQAGTCAPSDQGPQMGERPDGQGVVMASFWKGSSRVNDGQVL